jgi:hypothetical protein
MKRNTTVEELEATLDKNYRQLVVLLALSLVLLVTFAFQVA